ncbi:hypothetical protein HDF11_001224 [Tunturiibacter psychrotolerans]|jgi:hypothetical protein
MRDKRMCRLEIDSAAEAWQEVSRERPCLKPMNDAQYQAISLDWRQTGWDTAGEYKVNELSRARLGLET